MRVITVNLHRGRKVTFGVAAFLVLVVLLSGTVGFISKISRENFFFEPADSIPYENIVIIDAGHGGEDCGAIGVDGVYEKEINLQIAMTLGEMLMDEGYIVVYTRTDDRLLYKEEENIKGIRKISDLKNRCEFAKNYPDSIFVSIHQNSFASSKYSGLQVWYSKNDSRSKALANFIQSNVKNTLQPNNNRTIKEATSSIFLLHNASFPAVLIECGFLSNAEECALLATSDYQKQMATVIADAIADYIAAHP